MSAGPSPAGRQDCVPGAARRACHQIDRL